MVKIKVNVYDLTASNRAFRWLKLGVYHSSVVLDDKEEYFYGYFGEKTTGVHLSECLNMIPDYMEGEFYTSYDICDISLSFDECKNIIQSFMNSTEWMSEYYNFMYHNCNDFSHTLCETLVGIENMKNYPYWVLRTQKIAHFVYSISFSPMLSHLLGQIGFGLPFEQKQSAERQHNLDAEIYSNYYTQNEIDSINERTDIKQELLPKHTKTKQAKINSESNLESIEDNSRL